MAQQECKSSVGEGIAYVVVGTSGTGKSSLINLFVDKNNKAKVSHTSAAGTMRINCHKCSNSNGTIFIDTIGIDDPNGKKDKEIEIEVLKYLESNNISNVAIIWCINPNQDRKLRSLQTQAKYIDSFCKGKIWDSTIIVVKQGEACTKDNGAIEAASDYFDKKQLNIPCIGYTCADWLVGSKRDKYEEMLAKYKGNSEILKDMGYVSCKDVKILIEEALKKMKNESCQVLFENSICVKCDIIGDSRVMPNKCHSKFEWKHDGKLIEFESKEHSGQIILTEVTKGVARYHPGSIEWYHPGCVINSYTYFGPLQWNHQNKYDCCGGWKGSGGCKKRYTCCGDDSGQGCQLKELKESKITMSCCGGGFLSACTKSEMKWTCCGAGANDKGCKETCDACGQKWNNRSWPRIGPGCSDKFDHDIESL